MRKLIVSIFVAALLLGVGPANSLERESLAIDRDNPKAEATYGTFAGADPLLIGSAESCRTATNCDTIDVAFDPTAYEADKWFIGVSFTLAWNAQEGAVDLDMYVYDEEGNQVADSATGAQPEVAGLDVGKARDKHTYSIVVHNFAGGEGTFYDITVDLIADEIKEIPKLELPTAPPTTPPTPVPTPTPIPTPTPFTITFPPVQTPGGDGDPAEVPLTALASAANRDHDTGGGSGWAVLGGALGGLAVVAGGGVFAQRRLAARRR